MISAVLTLPGAMIAFTAEDGTERVFAAAVYGGNLTFSEITD